MGKIHNAISIQWSINWPAQQIYINAPQVKKGNKTHRVYIAVSFASYVHLYLQFLKQSERPGQQTWLSRARKDTSYKLNEPVRCFIFTR